MAKASTDAVCLRSYKQNSHCTISATISQAALATSAAPSYFPPVEIGSSCYIDGALRYNNPVNEVEAEARHLWCPDQVELKSLVKCFLSIGTGTPAKEAISDKALKFMKSNLASLVTDTEATHQSFQDRWLRQLKEKRFFRFDVTQGLQSVDIADYQKRDMIRDLTDAYMNEGDQKIKLQDCAENLMEKERTYNSLLKLGLSSSFVYFYGNQVGSTFADICFSARHSIGFS